MVAAVVGAEAQGLGDPGAAHDDARVEQPARVERVLDRDHRLVEPGAEELRQEPAPRAAAAVLARDRAVVVGDEPADLGRQHVHARHAARRLEVDHGPEVQAPGRRVAGEAGAGAVRRDDPLQVGDERGQPLGSHRRVLDERRRTLRPRRAHEQRQGGAAQSGRLGQVLGRLEPGRPVGAELAGERPQAGEAGERLLLAALILDGEHRGVVAVEQRRHTPERGDVGRPAQRGEVEELDRRRPGLEDGEVRLQRGAERRERERRAHAPGRARVEQHLQLGEQRERAFRAGEHPAKVRLGREELAQVVAGGAALRLREARGDGLAVLLAHPRECGREPLPPAGDAGGQAGARPERSAAGPGASAGAGAERGGGRRRRGSR